MDRLLGGMERGEGEEEYELSGGWNEFNNLHKSIPSQL